MRRLITCIHAKRNDEGKTAFHKFILDGKLFDHNDETDNVLAVIDLSIGN